MSGLAGLLGGDPAEQRHELRVVDDPGRVRRRAARRRRTCRGRGTRSPSRASTSQLPWLRFDVEHQPEAVDEQVLASRA